METFVIHASGRTVHYLENILPFGTDLPLDDYLAAGLLVYFGVNTLKEAWELPEGENSKMNEEREDAEEAISDVVAKEDNSEAFQLILSTFALVFLAEWGDKSQLSTIALSATYSPISVMSGAVGGFLPICLVRDLT